MTYAWQEWNDSFSHLLNLPRGHRALKIESWMSATYSHFDPVLLNSNAILLEQFLYPLLLSSRDASPGRGDDSSYPTSLGKYHCSLLPPWLDWNDSFLFSGTSTGTLGKTTAQTLFFCVNALNCKAKKKKKWCICSSWLLGFPPT